MTGRRPVGLITGLASEARVAAKLAEGLADDIPKPLIAVAGASARRAGQIAQDLLRQGASALVSFGIAGGLDPNLKVGDYVLATSIFTPEHHLLPCDEGWHEAVFQAAEEAGDRLHQGRFAGSDWAVTSPRLKAWLHHVSGEAMLVDMESHAVARIAWEEKVPFLALRCVVDDAGTSLPSIVRGSIGSTGHPRKALVAFRLALSPWNYQKLRYLEANSKQAHQALEGLSPLAQALFRGPL